MPSVTPLESSTSQTSFVIPACSLRLIRKAREIRRKERKDSVDGFCSISEFVHAFGSLCFLVSSVQWPESKTRLITQSFVSTFSFPYVLESKLLGKAVPSGVLTSTFLRVHFLFFFFNILASVF